MLYNLVACPHRVTMDLYADPAKRDEPNAFVRMLWERGSLYEREVIAGLKLPFIDLSEYPNDERERLTLEAIGRAEPLIYGGRVRDGDLLGDPDLLRREADGYVAGDIKSGAGEEGPDDDPSPKVHYAVQLALYTDILERKKLSPARRAFVWDIYGREVPYDFTELQGKRNPHTLWQDYEGCIAEARAIIATPDATRAAYGSVCKYCHWYTPCTEDLVATDDLTLIPELGRPKRDAMFGELQRISDLAACNPDVFIKGKKTVFSGIGAETLQKFHVRASRRNARPLPSVRPSPIPSPTSTTAALARSTTIQNMNVQSIESFEKSTRTSALPMISRLCSILRTPWISIPTSCAERLNGRRGISPSRQSRSISALPGGTLTRRGRLQSSGLIVGLRRVIQLSSNASSNTTRTTAVPRESSLMQCAA
jgi:predicted RecB family nuclease